MAMERRGTPIMGAGRVLAGETPALSKGNPSGSERPSHPAQTTGVTGVKSGSYRNAVDEGTPGYFLSQGRYNPTRF